MRRRFFVAAALSLLTSFVAASVAAAPADPVASFYRGRTIQLLIGFGPTGGYDTYARTLARHMGKHIPGNPDDRAAEHAGRGFAESRELHLQCRAQGRHRDRDLRARASDGEAAGPHRGPGLRRDEIHLDRQHHGRTQRLRLLASVRGPHLGGYEVQAVQARRFGPAHRPRYLLQRAAQPVPPAGPTDQRLSRRRRRRSRDAAP